MKRLAWCCLALLLMGCDSWGPTSGEVFHAMQCYGLVAKMDSTVTVLRAATLCWEKGKSPL